MSTMKRLMMMAGSDDESDSDDEAPSPVPAQPVPKVTQPPPSHTNASPSVRSSVPSPVKKPTRQDNAPAPAPSTPAPTPPITSTPVSAPPSTATAPSLTRGTTSPDIRQSPQKQQQQRPPLKKPEQQKPPLKKHEQSQHAPSFSSTLPSLPSSPSLRDLASMLQHLSTTMNERFSLIDSRLQRLELNEGNVRTRLEKFEIENTSIRTSQKFVTDMLSAQLSQKHQQHHQQQQQQFHPNQQQPFAVSQGQFTSDAFQPFNGAGSDSGVLAQSTPGFLSPTQHNNLVIPVANSRSISVEDLNVKKFTVSPDFKFGETDDEKACLDTIQRHARSSLLRKKWYFTVKSIVMMYKRRHYVAKEILQTEQIYVSQLEEIVKTFITPLKAEAIISQEEIDAVFLNVETLYEFHLIMLANLEERLANWSTEQRLGDIFNQLCPYLKLYTTFINDYEESLNVSTRLLSKKSKAANKRFSVFIENVESDQERGCGKMLFQNLLGAPFQRVPRYALLLRELVKYTPAEHDDYEAVVQARKSVEEVTTHINKTKAHKDEVVRAHTFRMVTFGKPTWCEHCSAFIWGLRRQGLECKLCHVSLHKKCGDEFSMPCDGETMSTGSFTSIVEVVIDQNATEAAGGHHHHKKKHKKSSSIHGHHRKTSSKTIPKNFSQTTPL
eukprot:TRINITY_DN283_c0_g1_i1.p1 TRINITY_DN283_c0_g1~~TRINITY_DN283_c0_g1_i1.p1  ORF type:complete len:689 (-),score=161.60 TRINITY_DN283_c0_g1_i1:79-2073(-)